MKILIIDDNYSETKTLQSLLTSFLENKRIDYTVTIATSIPCLNELNNSYDLIFFDIEIGEQNGIDAAREFRTINKETRIIFVSNYEKYLIDGYKVNADRYFIKPINSAEFDAEMNDVMKSIILQSLYFFDPKVYNKKIYYSNILYIEILQRHTYIHMLNKEVINTNFPLKYWQEIFKDGFFVQSHKAFLINLQNVTSYNNTSINLFNNENIPLSRNYKALFTREYQLYLETLI